MKSEHMRVLHIAEGVGFRHGGPGIDLPNYCRAMAQLGAGITLAVAWTDEIDEPKVVLGSTRWDFPSGGCFEIKGFRSLKPYRWRMAPALLPWLWRHITEFDVVHLHSLYSFPVFQGALAATIVGKPFVVSIHGVLAPVQRKVSPYLKAIYGRLLLNPLLPHAAAIIFSTERERDDAGDLVAGLPSFIIPNGIMLDRYEQLPRRGQFRERYVSGWSGPIILYLGRINAKKGLDVLVPAFARVIAEGLDARLVIAGPSDPATYRKNIERMIINHELSEKIVLTGGLSEDEKTSAFADADLFVLPSRSENFGSAMFEAMACGLPVVVSTGVDMHGEVTTAGAGLAVPLDAEALVGAMKSMFANNAVRETCAIAARTLARRYSSEQTAKRILILYNEIITNHAARIGRQNLLRRLFK